MTSDQREVLDFLTKGWKFRLRNQAWVLKESGRISSYVNIPGGEPTLRQLQKLGQIDAQNNITELGRVAVAGSAQVICRLKTSRLLQTGAELTPL